MNCASSEARKSAALAMSTGFDMRPNGIVATNFAAVLGRVGHAHEHLEQARLADHGIDHVHADPVGAELRGHRARGHDRRALDPLYQVSPGRGRTPAVEAMVTKHPPPALRKCGTACFAVRKSDFTLTA